MDKIHYEGNGYEILNNPLIIKLISEHKIEFRDNKLFVDAMIFEGTQKFSGPVYTLPGMKMFREAFEGAYIYEVDDVPYVDYDPIAVEKLLGIEDVDIDIIARDFRHGVIKDYKYNKKGCQ